MKRSVDTAESRVKVTQSSLSGSLSNEKIEKSNREAQLATQPIKSLLLQYALPTLISFLVEGFYGIIDLWILGMGREGETATAAFGAASPIELVIMAFSVLIGVGSSVSIGKFLGAQRYEQAGLTFFTGIFMCFGSGVFLALSGIFGRNLYCKAVGAVVGTDVFVLIQTYLIVSLCGAVTSHLSMLSNQVLRSEGKSSLSSIIMVIGACCNLFFDLIFVLWFDLGLLGAVWATVIGRFTTALLAFTLHFIPGKSIIPLSKVRFAPSFREIWRIIRLGSSACLAEIGQAIIQVMEVVVLVRSAPKTRTDAFLGALALGARTSLFIYFLIQAVTLAGAPIAAFALGRCDYHRFKETFSQIYSLSALIVVGPWLFLLIFAENVARIYTDDDDMAFIGAASIRYWQIAMPMTFFTLPLSQRFVTIEKPSAAVIHAAFRQFITQIPLFYLLSSIFGPYGVFLALPIAETLGTIVAIVLMYIHRRSLFLRDKYVQEKECHFELQN